MRLFRVMALCLAPVLTAGCDGFAGTPPPTPPPPDPDPCASVTCRDGEVCVAGWCEKVCPGGCEAGTVCVDGACVPDVAPAATLRLRLEGEPGGRVVSTPEGIACGMGCAGDFPIGEVVTLTALPFEHGIFEGWGGACAEATASLCVLEIPEAGAQVMATFAVVDDDAPPLPGRLRTDLWQPDGYLEAVAVHENVAYLGGRFEFLGPPGTGLYGAVDPETGARFEGFGGFEGEAVRALLPDGEGGLLLAGTFETRDGVAREGLARVGPDGALDPAVDVPVDGAVFVLYRDGDVLYLGGDFSEVAGVPRENFAALNAATYEVLDGTPAVDGSVHALAAAGEHLFVGGWFETVDGAPRANLAFLDRVTFTLRDAAVGTNGAVYALAAAEPYVYVGGGFDRIAGIWRDGLAYIDSETLTHGIDWTTGVGASVHALAVVGERLFLGGYFHEVGGEPRHRVASIDRSTGVVQPFEGPAFEGWGGVHALVVSDGVVYAGGAFTHPGDDGVRNLVALDADTGALLSLRAAPGRWVHDLALVDGRLHVAGDFPSMGQVRRHHLAAIDLSTGAPTDFAPRLHDLVALENWPPAMIPEPAVRGLFVHDGRLYVHGQFGQVDGEVVPNLAVFDLADGRRLPWGDGLESHGLAHVAASASADWAALMSPGRGAELWPLDPASGAPTGEPVRLSGTGNDLRVRDGRLFLAGTWPEDEDHTRVAVLDARTGASLGGAPDFDGSVRRLVPADDGLYAVGSFRHAGGHPLPGIAFFDAAGVRRAFAPAPDGGPGAVRGVIPMGSHALLHGRFQTLGGTDSPFLALVDRLGRPTGWRPDIEAPVDLLAVAGERLLIVHGDGLSGPSRLLLLEPD